jgi:hypothetical protein
MQVQCHRVAKAATHSCPLHRQSSSAPTPESATACEHSMRHEDTNASLAACPAFQPGSVRLAGPTKMLRGFYEHRPPCYENAANSPAGIYPSLPQAA